MKIKRFKSENGVVTVIVALSLVALMMVTALAIDVGSLYEERRHLQTVADAAALAGAQELPESSPNAIQVAINYAARHGVDITSDDVEISQTYVPEDTITVTPSNPDTPVYFAKVFGVNSVNVVTTATATANSPSSMGGLMPWTVPLEDYPMGLKSGKPYSLKVGPHDLKTPGWFQIMRFDGPGAAVYGETIVKGCKSEIWIWTLENPVDYRIQTGNIAGPTRMSIDERLKGHEDCTFEEVVGIDNEGKYYVKKGACPRIVYIPLIETRPKNASERVKIVEFSIFFLEDVSQKKNVFTVTGRFVDKMIANSSGEITGYSGGIKVIRLVE